MARGIGDWRETELSDEDGLNDGSNNAVVVRRYAKVAERDQFSFQREPVTRHETHTLD